VTPLVRLEGVSKAFDGVRALRGISFELGPGEVHALVGENGAGKSTLLGILTGAHRPDAGRIEIAGAAVERNDPVRSRGLGVAAVRQQPSLFPDLSVAENLALGTEPPGLWRRVRWAERRARARALLERAGARVDPDAPASSLTLPEQQLVEIARALGAAARILVLDEPTASLSRPEVENLFRVIAELKAAGAGIVYVSHRLDEVFRIADRVTVLRDGEAVGTRPVGEIDRDGLIRLMVGREVARSFPARDSRPGEVLLETRGLGSRAAGIRDVDLELRSGEILGLAGLVGAGRTGLARVLFGLEPADCGEILLRGRPVAWASPLEAAGRGIAYLPEDRRRHGVIPPMSLAANVTLAVLGRLRRRGLLDLAREREIATAAVERLSIRAPSIAEPVSSLSGGNQQKVAVARWLAAGPSILILDEPTQGIDVAARAEIHALVSGLAARGLAVLLISSDLPEVLGMSDRVAVMRGGTVVGVLPRDQATPEAAMALALGRGAA
jgi:rhamnose transport system ATP-binding protein